MFRSQWEGFYGTASRPRQPPPPAGKRLAATVPARTVMKPIWIALTDDWELRGDGGGDVVALQHRPALALMELYAGCGIPATFCVETLQQLAFERFADADPGLARGRDLWRETVARMAAGGFDVALHLHPQWLHAAREDGFWRLDRRWNLADYDDEEIEDAFDRSLAYLRDACRLPAPAAFRAGSWGACCPSATILRCLRRHGIRIDVSVVNGLHFWGENVALDYRNLASPYRPYYPDADDIRRPAAKPGDVVEIPTQSIPLSGAQRLEALAAKAARLLGRTLSRPLRWGADTPPPAAPHPAAPGAVAAGLTAATTRSDHIIDLSRIDEVGQRLFNRLLDRVIDRALRENRPPAFLVFENHTKCLRSPGHFRRIETALRHIRVRHGDVVAFVTLREMADNLDRIRPALAD